MPNDDIDHIPSISATREEASPRSSGSARGATGGQRGASGPAPRSQGAGLLARLFITVSLVVAAVACAWAWQLQMQLQLADASLAGYAARIGDLEDRLSDTDQGMNQNAAVQAVKISELETEVRKLWDNVWKQTKERLDKLEAANGAQDKGIKNTTAGLARMESQVKGVSDEIAKLKSVAGDMSRLMSSAKANQAEVERVADTLNRINLDLAKLEKRVQGNEEWVGSINAFRKQVNASLSELQDSLRTMQSSPRL